MKTNKTGVATTLRGDDRPYGMKMGSTIKLNPRRPRSRVATQVAAMEGDLRFLISGPDGEVLEYVWLLCPGVFGVVSIRDFRQALLQELEDHR